MKLSLFFLFFTIAFMSQAEASPFKRMNPWQELLNERSDDVVLGKCDVKINVRTKGAVLSIKFPGSDEFKEVWEGKEGKFYTATLDSGKYVFKLEKPGHQTLTRRVILKSQHVYEVSAYSYKPRPVGVKKPAIYIYNDELVEFNLNIKPKGNFVYTYPQITKSGWHLKAGPSGKIFVDDKEYDYLFWEGEQDVLEVNQSEGFIVAKENTMNFLEEKLSILGLNDKEQNDFIAYWGPILQKNDHNFIHFITGDDYADKLATYASSEKIDTEIRIFMAYKPAQKTDIIQKQVLKPTQRKGLTLVEWGGGEVPNYKNAL